MGTSEVLREMITVTQELGHCKHMVEDDSGRVCYIGAFGYVCSRLALFGDDRKPFLIKGPVHQALLVKAEELYPDLFPIPVTSACRHTASMLDFNNHPEVTEDMLITVYEKVALDFELAGD